MSNAVEIIKVTTATLINTLRDIFKANMLVPLILGPSGIGKSTIIAALSWELVGYVKETGNPIHISTLIDTRLGQMQEEDLTGLPEIEIIIIDPGSSCLKKGDAVSREVFYMEFLKARSESNQPPIGSPRTTYRLPSFFPHDGWKGIWFFDEANRAKPGMQQCLFQLVLDRKYFNYEVPKECRLAFAGNWSPNEVQYQVSELDPALRNRFVIIYYTGPTYEEWKEWAVDKGIDDRIISFLGMHNDLLVTEGKDEKPFPSPRSWEMADMALKSASSRDSLSVQLAGLIGPEASVMLMNFIDTEYEALPSPSDLPKALELIRKWVRKGQNDRTTAFLDKIIEHAAENGSYTVEEFNWFGTKLPKEFAFSLYKGMYENAATAEFATECVEANEEIFEMFSVGEAA